MFWSDPLADFASLVLFGVSEDDPALLSGYRSGNGRADFDRPARCGRRSTAATSA